jgi:hypothetical protein
LKNIELKSKFYLDIPSSVKNAKNIIKAIKVLNKDDVLAPFFYQNLNIIIESIFLFSNLETIFLK